jgi:hypothetical protein
MPQLTAPRSVLRVKNRQAQRVRRVPRKWRVPTAPHSVFARQKIACRLSDNTVTVTP